MTRRFAPVGKQRLSRFAQQFAFRDRGGVVSGEFHHDDHRRRVVWKGRDVGNLPDFGCESITWAPGRPALQMT
jgi:hypothetical protein